MSQKQPNLDLTKEETQTLKILAKRRNWFTNLSENVQKELLRVWIAWSNNSIKPLTAREVWTICTIEYPEIKVCSDTFRRWLRGEQ